MKSLKIGEMKQMMYETGRVSGIVPVSVHEIINCDTEEFYDLLSEKLTGSNLLMASDYEVIGLENNITLLVCVTGDASMIIETEDTGWDIFDFDGTGMLKVQKIDGDDRFKDDGEAVRQAMEDGIKVIPVEELPKDFDKRYLGWVDTPENRKRIEGYCQSQREALQRRFGWTPASKQEKPGEPGMYYVTLQDGNVYEVWLEKCENGLFWNFTREFRIRHGCENPEVLAWMPVCRPSAYQAEQAQGTKHEDKIIIIIRDGILSDVRIPTGMELNIEALQIDKDYPDYERLREYEDRIYEDARMRSADVVGVSFDE